MVVGHRTIISWKQEHKTFHRGNTENKDWKIWLLITKIMGNITLIQFICWGELTIIKLCPNSSFVRSVLTNICNITHHQLIWWGPTNIYCIMPQLIGTDWQTGLLVVRLRSLIIIIIAYSIDYLNMHHKHNLSSKDAFHIADVSISFHFWKLFLICKEPQFVRGWREGKVRRRRR